MQENGQDMHWIDAIPYSGVIDVLTKTSSWRVVRREDSVDASCADCRWTHDAESRLTRTSCCLYVLCWIRQVLSKQRGIGNQRMPQPRRGEHVSDTHEQHEDQPYTFQLAPHDDPPRVVATAEKPPHHARKC